MKQPRLKNAAAVQHGRNRFQKEAVATLFETEDEIKARRELYHALQFFPTPPWAVRALLETLRHQAGGELPFWSVLEPCAGRGHIVKPLREAGLAVRAWDIHDFGKGYEIRDFLGDWYPEPLVDVVIMNPPYGDKTSNPSDIKPTLAERFVRRALDLAPVVYSLCGLGFLRPTESRFDLFNNSLTDVYVHSERPSMILGEYDVKGGGATDYAWFRFSYAKTPSQQFNTHLIPLGLKARLMKPEDVKI